MARRTAVEYGVALIVTLAAVIARWLLDPVLGDELAVVTLFGGIAIAVWFGGALPAIAAMLLGYLACHYLFIAPRGQFALLEAGNLIGLVAYLVAAGLIIGFGEALRVARRNARERAESLRTTLLSIGDAVITTDARGSVTFLNPVAETLTGWTTEDATGRPLHEVFDIVNQETRTTVENQVNRVLKLGRVVALASHTVLVSKHGADVPIDDSAAPIRDADGAIVGVILVFRDCRTDAELRRNERELTDFFDNANVGFHWVGPDGAILRVNQTELDMLGYTREEYLGRSIADFHVDQPVIEDMLARLARGETVTKYPARMRAKDGSIRDVLVHSSALFEDGRFIHSRCFTLDVTEQKRAQVALQESEERFRLLADAAPVMIWMSGPDKEGIYFNETWLAFTGSSLEEQLGEGWLQQVHPDDREPLMEVCLGGFRSRKSFTTEFRLRRADGEYRWLLDCGSPRFDSQGNFQGFVGSCVEITDRKLAEDAQSRLAAIVQSSDDAIISKSLDDVILTWNDGAERLFGYSASEAVGQRLLLIVPPELHEEEQSFVERLRRGEHIEHFETVRISKSGRRIDVALTISPIRDAEGRIVGASKIARDISARKRAEEALQESERRLRLALEAGKMGTWEWQLDTNEVTWSPGLEVIHGLQPGTFPGTFEAYQSDIHAEDLDKVENAIRHTLECGDEHHLEYRIILPDGSLRWVEGRGKLFRNDDGTPLRMVGICTDITARKRAEAVLKAKEAELELVAKTTPLILTRCSHDLRYLFANRAAAARFGLEPEQMVGRPIVDIMGEQAFSIIKPHIDRVLRGEAVEFEADISYSVAGRRSVHVNYMPERDEHGEVAGWIASVIDITDRKRLEDDLREQRDNTQALLEALPVGVVIAHDPACRHVSGNQAAAQLLRMSLADNQSLAAAAVRPTHFRVLRDGREAAPEDLPVQRAARGEIIDGEELTHSFDDGSVIRTLVSARPVFDRAGQPRGGVVAMLDITALKEVEDALKEADRRKDEFLATLAHELRNPLAPIRNALELTKHSRGNSDILHNAHEMMERQLGHLVRLVDDLLDISRITRDRLELRRERVELASIIYQALESCRPLVRELRHRLSLNLSSEAIYVHADPVRLAQVFSNLINNACKYTEPGGSIWFASERQGSDVVITIKDNGIGISPEKLSEVFCMFVQMNHSLDRAHDGLGIGLTLVKRLVEMHGGTVGAHSDGLGKGSEFVVRLPVMIEPHAPHLPTTPVAQRSSESRRILVVDDNQDAAQWLAMLLKVAGHEAHTAHDGEAAVEAAEALRPDVVLLDIGLPKMNGHEVCRAIRHTAWGKTMTLIALTGWGQAEDRVKSEQAGFDGHLVKPIDLTEFDKILAQSRAQERSSFSTPT